MSVISNLNKENNSNQSIINSVLLINGIDNNDFTNNKEYNIKSKILSDKKRKKNLKKSNTKNIDDNEIIKVVNKFSNHYKNPFDLCVNALIQFKNYRNKEIIDLIIPYLKELIGLMDIISKEKSEELAEKILDQIAMNLQYKKILKNKYIYKYGDKGNDFYIILKGKAAFLVPRIIKCYLNEIEYINYLLKLKKCGENDLLRDIISLNRQYYDLGDDFDMYIRELIDDYKNNKNKSNSAFMTKELYETLLEVIKEDDNNKKKNIGNNQENENKKRENDEIINVEEYIERSRAEDMDLDSKNRKKINVYEYQITNYYEDGQIFGMAELESKYVKRTATVITLKDCDLGLLTREQYISTLEQIYKKSLEFLFNLINSYSILGLAPKKAFDNRFCHMFKCVRFKRGAQIMEENKKINSVIIFSSGQFTITINKNILEINDLIIKLQKIRVKMLGINENSKKNENLENEFRKEFILKEKFILPETLKMYHKKHNLTISIVNDKLVVGLLDTVDPETHLPLFNCTCLSAVCDGYEITNNSLDLVNKEYSCKNNNNQIFLINVEYFLKRLQLHMKEIESKIENFNKNLKYDIKPNKPVKNLEINDKKDEDNKIIIIDKNKNENNYEIRRNSFNTKKKNNNEISLVQKLDKSLKNDYFTIKKQKYNSLDKSIDSSNLNSDNKRYENIKTIDVETVEDNKERNLSYFSKIKRSIKRKEHLLQLALNKSNKYMIKKKAEMRSLNIARKARYKRDQYYDLSKFFNKSISSSKDKIKNPLEKDKNDSSQKKDLVLDKIINNINKDSKYQRILSSYLTPNRRNKINNAKTDIERKNNEKKEEKKIYQSIKLEKNDSIYNIKKNFIKRMETEDNLKFLDNKSKNYIKNEKGVIYPFIKPNIRNLLYDNYNKNNTNNLFENKTKNIITIDAVNSLENQDDSKNKSSRKIYKNYNNVINNNYRISRKLLQLNKLNNKSIGIQINLKEKAEVPNNKLPNIVSFYDKDKVHFFDPLVLDKFNDNYYNKKLKTLEK